jgi:2-methylcitrate dehydratase PrpD
VNTVTEGLAERIVAWRSAGVPDAVRHQSARLVLNALKGSVEAYDHPVIAALCDWQLQAAGPGDVPLLWRAERLPGESAALVNTAMLELLDFNENHSQNGPLHPTAPVLPALLADAQRLGLVSGVAFLDALAIGVEVELALADALMWSTYRRGFMTGVLVGGVAAAAACCALRGFDAARTAQALAFAMTCGHGAMENFGSAGHALNLGLASRNGLAAVELAERGLTTALTAFEGFKGMASAYSDEDPQRAFTIVAGLAEDPWKRIFEPTFKSYPTETITQATVTCVLGVSAGLSEAERRGVQRLELETSPLVAEIAAERHARFGPALADDLQAKFDLRFCAASAWLAGRFGAEQMQRPAHTDPAVLDLRERVVVRGSEARAVESAALVATLGDGRQLTFDCPWSRGAAANPLEDADIAALLRRHAAGRVAEACIEAIVAAVWALEADASPLALAGLVGAAATQ